jgi:thioredoxin reductase
VRPCSDQRELPEVAPVQIEQVERDQHDHRGGALELVLQLREVGGAVDGRDHYLSVDDRRAKTNDAPCLEVDSRQRTTVAGIYAGGDVVSDLHQIAVANGHAAIAATYIHKSLPENFKGIDDAVDPALHKVPDRAS